MISAIIVDDEKRCINSLQSDILKYCPDVEVLATCTSAKEARKLIKKHNPKLVFLDVLMPYENGFELLESLDEIKFDVVFTTADDSYAVEAFKVNAVGYLLKPIDKDDLIKIVDKIKSKTTSAISKEQLENISDYLNPSNPFKRIAVPVKDGYDLILVKDIVYCEADGNYSGIYLNSGKKLFISYSLKEIEDLFPKRSFCRIHNSYLINVEFNLVKYVRGDGGYVVMSDGASLSVSRSRKDELLERINQKYK